MEMKIYTRTAPSEEQINRYMENNSIRAVEGEGNERKFLLSFSSEEPYERWFGTEILDHSDGCVDLKRLNEIGCVLFNHKRDAVIGKVLRAWIENGRGMAEIEFDTDEESEKIYQKVRSGTLKGVSVGYGVSVWEEVASGKKSADGRFQGPVSIAKKWEIYEISIVSVPADSTVGVGREVEESTGGSFVDFARQLAINKNITGGNEKGMNKKELVKQKIQRQQDILNGCKAAGRELNEAEKKEFEDLQREITELNAQIEAEERQMGSRPVETGQEQERSAYGNAGFTAPGAAEESGNIEQVRSEERERIAQISALCREFGMDDSLSDFIKNGNTVDNVRAAIIENLKENKKPLNGRVVVETDEGDKFRSAVSDAILMRGGIHLDNPAPGARDFMGLSLREIAVECLAADGQSGMNRKSADELFGIMQRQFFNPSAAFPVIMDNAINKAYVEGHRTAPVTFDKWTKRGTLNDFKIHDNNYLSGPAGELEEVPESGELKHDVWKDEKRPTRKLKTYGKQFTMSRQAFINDDVGLIVQMPAKYAASARKTINKRCYKALIGNPVIYDGAKLFDAKHKNLLAKGTGITREAMQGMIMALSNQVDEFGEVCIIRPSVIIVPSGYQFDMYTLFYSPTIHTSDNTQAVNPLYQYRESIEVVEDPTINILCGGFGNQMPWWLLGAKEDTDFIEVDYLNGQDIPNIRRSEVPGTLGFVWDIYMDWGIAAMDYRGAIMNPGVVVKNTVELAK